MARTEQTGEKRGGAIVWTVLALVGTAALAYVIARRVVKGEDPLDADALLEAADQAANNLDLILVREGQTAS